MAKREYVYTVKALDNSNFPDDMLRYDVARIICKHNDGSVTVAGKYPPTAERWRSFGWHVSID